MRKTVLLCPPKYFEIKYEINPWMNKKIPVDRDKAMREFKILKNTYQKLGIEIHEITQRENLPDMIYTANYGNPIMYDAKKQKKTGKKGLFIKANFKHKVRQAESELAKYYFEGAGFEIAELPKDIAWEGQGDLIKAGGTYVLGHGKLRSDIRAKGLIADLLGIPEKDILDLEMIDPNFYHVDTVIGALNNSKRTVVVNPKALTKEDLRRLHSKIDDVIYTNDQDNSVMAPNLVGLGNNVIIGKGISTQLRNEFKKRDIKVFEVPMTESLKGGGSVKCNTLEYY